MGIAFFLLCQLTPLLVALIVTLIGIRLHIQARIAKLKEE